MKIAIGITNGLSCLHNQENIVHGNLTSSNILLDEQTNPHITDFGLSRLMTTSANTNTVAPMMDKIKHIINLKINF